MLRLPSGPVLHPSIAPFTMLFQRDTGAGHTPRFNLSNSPFASPMEVGVGENTQRHWLLQWAGASWRTWGVAWAEDTAKGLV